LIAVVDLLLHLNFQPIEKKLKYQVDKLLTLEHSGGAETGSANLLSYKPSLDSLKDDGKDSNGAEFESGEYHQEAEADDVYRPPKLMETTVEEFMSIVFYLFN
jgi:hypothetical protein